VLLKNFLIFLLGFVFAFFCGKNQCVAPICTGPFWFICVFFYVCMQSRFWYVDITTLCKHWLPGFTHIILSDQFVASPKLALFSCNVHVLPNIMHTPAFSNIFLLFRVPLAPTSPTAPICIDIYPSAPIRVSFCISAQNIMSGEISPAIRPKSMHFVSIYAHAWPVFLLAHTPVPYRTHPHPFAPICTHQNIKLHCISVLYMLI